MRKDENTLDIRGSVDWPKHDREGEYMIMGPLPISGKWVASRWDGRSGRNMGRYFDTEKETRDWVNSPPTYYDGTPV